MSRYLTLFVFVLYSTLTNAHSGESHQHMVREAYQYLKAQVGYDIPIMVERVGNNQKGDTYFNPGGLLVIGAYREDLEDIVYRLCGARIPFIWESCKFVTFTHFWDPDRSDGGTFNPPPTNEPYQNAFQKASLMLNGGYDLFWYNNHGEFYIYRYNSLVDLYLTGRMHQVGYMDTNGQIFGRDVWEIATETEKNKIVWEILGRICHLLGDMTIPAHVHNDPHPNYIDTGWNDDSYEEWMHINHYNWNRITAAQQGGLIYYWSSKSIKILVLYNCSDNEPFSF